MDSKGLKGKAAAGNPKLASPAKRVLTTLPGSDANRVKADKENSQSNKSAATSPYFTNPKGSSADDGAKQKDVPTILELNIVEMS